MIGFGAVAMVGSLAVTTLAQRGRDRTAEAS